MTYGEAVVMNCDNDKRHFSAQRRGCSEASRNLNPQMSFLHPSSALHLSLQVGGNSISLNAWVSEAATWDAVLSLTKLEAWAVAILEKVAMFPTRN